MCLSSGHVLGVDALFGILLASFNYSSSGARDVDPTS